MKVLGIAGSPRRGGNTDLLLEQVLAGAKSADAEVETLSICELKIAPCLHCDGCLKEGKCIIDDDMQKVYPKLRECDRLVIASPMFFMGLTAQTKAMIDRCQALWALKQVLKQPVALNSGGERWGLFVSAGGTGFSTLFQSAMPTLKAWFAVLDIKSAGELTFARVDEKGAIRNHPTALKDAFEAGRKLVTG
ncbi:MAG: flavodoxin family protein [Dehalococcoidia bacterium]|nr:flavodoxin family protein [Dehalococcoidia bacterium]